MIYIFCGNSRSGSTLQYNMGKLIFEALNLDYVDMGYKKFLNMDQLQKMEKGTIYILKTHSPKLIEKENIRYISVVRCSGYVSASLARVWGLGDKGVLDILARDYEQTRCLTTMENAEIQIYDEYEKIDILSLARLMRLDLNSDQAVYVANKINNLKYSRKNNFKQTRKNIFALLRFINKIVKINPNNDVFWKTVYMLKGIDPNTHLHFDHVSTEEYKSVVCKEKSCSMCLVRQSDVCLQRMKKTSFILAGKSKL